MAEEESATPKRVVKKVVKRPSPPPTPTITPPSAATPSERSVRAARLATRTRPDNRTTAPAGPRRRPVAPSPAAPPSGAVATQAPAQPPIEAPDETTPTRRRSFKPTMPTLRRPGVPHVPTPDIRQRVQGIRGKAGDGIHAVGDGIAAFFARIRDAIVDAWHWLIDLRLPHLSPMRGSAITGLIVGLMSVGLGRAFYELFSATRGTSAGGGWGFLAVVFVGFVAFIVGELLLGGFGVAFGRSISILSVLLVLSAILLLFLDLAAGIWALLIVPTLFVLAYLGSCRMMLFASGHSAYPATPWEPNDETYIT